MTGWQAFVDKILARTEEAPVNALASVTNQTVPDPPDTVDGLPSWVEAWEMWEMWATRRKGAA